MRGVEPSTVSRIYAQFTERKAKERLSLDCPRVLGIDEHTLHKGQRFATTFCDLKRHRVFDISPGRSEAELASYLAKLRGREQVRVVCIDLSNSYRSMIRRWFPRAAIVADRFHAIRLVGAHLLKLARQLCPALGWNRSWLGLLRTRPDRLDPGKKTRLAKLLADYPALQGIYDTEGKALRIAPSKTPVQAGLQILHPTTPRHYRYPQGQRARARSCPSKVPLRVDRRDRAHVALHQKQRHHRGLPQKNEINPTKSVRIPFLLQLPPPRHRSMRLTPLQPSTHPSTPLPKLSCRPVKSGSSAGCRDVWTTTAVLGELAERGGFEPSVRFYPYNGLANRPFRPLRHLSVTDSTMSYGKWLSP